MSGSWLYEGSADKLQLFWSGSRDFWQSNWRSLRAAAPPDEFFFALMSLYIIPFIVYVFYSGLLSFLDVTGKPAFLVKYKTQDEKEVPVDRAKFIRAVKQVAFNLIVLGVPLTWFSTVALQMRGCPMGEELPSFPKFAVDMAGCMIVMEIAFYYTHRMLHLPYFYKRVHKQHHEWISTTSIISLYAHPFEHVISNFLPVAIGPILMKSHLVTAVIWPVVALMGTCNAHSGYHFPGFFSPEAHDFHHYKFTNMYGMMGWLDWLHGTDVNFRESKHFERHYTSYSATPLRELHPSVRLSPQAKQD